MKRLFSFVLLGMLVFSLIFGFAAISPQRVSAQDEVRNAVASLYDAAGNRTGSISFAQLGGNRVSVVAAVTNLPPGYHGLHVHNVGLCEAPFSSAGGHHGAEAGAHPTHAGDLPALLVNADGTGMMTVITDRFTVASLVDADGSAVIVHASPDNYANIPPRYGIAVDEETTGTGDSGERIACGVVQDAVTFATAGDNLWAVNALPLDQLPATVNRETGAENGVLTMTIPALGGLQIVGQIVSADGGQIGTVTQEGDMLIFTFTEVTYNVSPIELPNGQTLGAQSIRLDQSQPNTIRVNLTNGEIARDFHWLMTATDAQYNGTDTVPLGDTARTEVVEVLNVGENQYTIRMVTHWKSTISLDTWTVGGQTLPGGELEASAEFNGTYLIDFNK